MRTTQGQAKARDVAATRTWDGGLRV